MNICKAFLIWLYFAMVNLKNLKRLNLWYCGCLNCRGYVSGKATVPGVAFNISYLRSRCLMWVICPSVSNVNVSRRFPAMLSFSMAVKIVHTSGITLKSLKDKPRCISSCTFPNSTGNVWRQFPSRIKVWRLGIEINHIFSL